MHKHIVWGLLAVLILFAGSAQAQTFEEQAIKNINEHIASKCTTNNLSPALCECEMNNAKSTQFTIFTKSLKSEADSPKLEEYYVQNIVAPCVLNRSVAQKLCVHHIKQKNTEYSDKVINGYCECSAEEIAENVSKGSLAGLDRYQIMAKLSEENEKAFTTCNTQRN